MTAQGDVEALAAFLHTEWCNSSHHRAEHCLRDMRAEGLDYGKAERILASDWLAARDATQRAEAWDEGYEKRADAVRAFLPRGKGVPSHLNPPNPYRANRGETETGS